NVIVRNNGRDPVVNKNSTGVSSTSVAFNTIMRN
ncbi:MAG: hypothetical protein ACI91R_001998, partial [Vicingaceae bacterium]